MKKINSAELVLIRGLPGSGKSTIAKTMSAYKHFEADMYFIKEGVYSFEAKKLQQAHDWCYEQVRQALKAGHKVVVANTFVRRWQMQRYIQMAKKHGITVRIITATGNWKSIHDVPETTLVKMRNSWQSEP